MRDVVQQLEEAALLRRQGNPAGALRILTRLAAAGSQRADLAYQTAWALDVLGQDRDAARHYGQALTLDRAAGRGDGALSLQDRRGAYLGLGLMLIRLGEPTAAVDELKRGVQEYADDAQLRTLLQLAQDMANR